MAGESIYINGTVLSDTKNFNNELTPAITQRIFVIELDENDNVTNVGGYSVADLKEAIDTGDWAKVAERWAKGSVSGTPVNSGDGYQDNAKYYANLAALAKAAAEAAQVAVASDKSAVAADKEDCEDLLASMQALVVTAGATNYIIGITTYNSQRKTVRNSLGHSRPVEILTEV